LPKLLHGLPGPWLGLADMQRVVPAPIGTQAVSLAQFWATRSHPSLSAQNPFPFASVVKHVLPAVHAVVGPQEASQR
jgi:hypothetical protein